MYMTERLLNPDAPTVLTTDTGTGFLQETILQEKGNLYEKMEYHQTGQIEHINDRMDIVFYEKN